MDIIIAGGTGFIGRELVDHFVSSSYQVSVISRDAEKIFQIFGNKVKNLTWKQLQQQGSQSLKGANILINLAGANIGSKLWSVQRKQEILSSRIDTTSQLAKWCSQLGKSAPSLLNASAIGVYGLQEACVFGLPPALDEKIPIDYNSAPDFLAKVARAWEKATWVAKDAGVRVVNMRFGVVLGKQGGALKQLVLPFKYFVGGKIGSGQQPFSWIALDDLIKAIDFIINHNEITGPINLVAPQSVTQNEFAKLVGKILHRPTKMVLPAWLLKLITGQMAEELLLRGQHVIPKRLLEEGFVFSYDSLEKALVSILGSGDNCHCER